VNFKLCKNIKDVLGFFFFTEFLVVIVIIMFSDERFGHVV